MKAEWLDTDGTLIRQAGTDVYEVVLRITFTGKELADVPLAVHLSRLPQAVQALVSRRSA